MSAHNSKIFITNEVIDMERIITMSTKDLDRAEVLSTKDSFFSSF
jgi:hypothetical protein